MELFSRDEIKLILIGIISGLAISIILLILIGLPKVHALPDFEVSSGQITQAELDNVWSGSCRNLAQEKYPVIGTNSFSCNIKQVVTYNSGNKCYIERFTCSCKYYTGGFINPTLMT